MSRILIPLMSVLVAILSSTVVADEKKNDVKDASKDSKIELSAEEQKLFEQTNKIRTENKLKPLTINPLLLKAARAHSANMAKQEKMEHKLDGKNPRDRADTVGYEGEWCGENVGEGTDGATKHSIKDMMDWWMKSPDHRKNILFEEFTEVGFGVAKGKNGKTYYTQMFGAIQMTPTVPVLSVTPRLPRLGSNLPFSSAPKEPEFR